VFDNFSSIFHIEATDGKSYIFFNTKILFFCLYVFSSLYVLGNKKDGTV